MAVTGRNQVGEGTGSVSPRRRNRGVSTIGQGVHGREKNVEFGPMESPKEQVQQILEMLPEDASLEDIQYHIYVRQKIEQGLDDAAAGRVVSHEEVQQRLAKWLTK